MKFRLDFDDKNIFKSIKNRYNGENGEFPAKIQEISSNLFTRRGFFNKQIRILDLEKR